MSFWLHPEAEAELGDAAVYYAEHASPAIARAFLAEFERVRNLLIARPGLGRRSEPGLRVHAFHRFPYNLIYEHDASLGLCIYAVAHQHRAPGYWAARV